MIECMHAIRGRLGLIVHGANLASRLHAITQGCVAREGRS